MGDTIRLHLPETDTCVLLKVVKVVKYASFRDMLEAETIDRVLPDGATTTVDDGVAVYRQFYTESIEKKKGVIAIHVETSAPW